MSMVEIDTENNKIRDKRTFTASGTSTILSFPPELLDTLELDKGDEVEIEGDWASREITIRPVEDEE
ncbi:AbrB/MazE/SpoVT family DNA-binding domain-containing protein [Haloterrigena jeotgali icosahedral virus 1]|uniref:AbrB/MazE/SpoVT family DNA-binding domain-containing protein n=2 Tax=root TaxID=1 RepID=A0AAF0PFW8_9EURY|nr:AbrB/MazE/SpoVT family DNA-binding domain-containing protein [Natrinema thermotolerans]YP_010772641.1 AbrB/MazE/SpoVT family DNA-binding domain-containing protein [Haloterrigena jeotgali icosahedral virus 1]QCC57406.1 AbrB/MazE/SpoVT family DNA-binding domain-containing protein [Natrinema thermotolerans]WMT10390.1 AbrB/MazE/SpoVT family DNA-binding domain-containing protein [Natrinema thermotolerans]WPH65803.1 hypothetical protein HJIV1_gp12 [Haloterrigena jeotgali icosahedral virus 1]DAC85